MDKTDTSQFIVLLTSLFVACIAWKWFTRKKIRLPPGPIGLPLLGYWPFLGKNVAHKNLYKLKEKYGPIVSMYWGRKLVVVLMDFPTLKEAFSRDAFLGRPSDTAFTLVKDGVSFNELSGPAWKANRAITMQILRDIGFGKSEDHVQKEVSEILKYFQKAKGEIIETRIPLTSSVSNNVTSLIFGRRLDYSDPMRKFLDHLILLIVSFHKQTTVHAYFPWLQRILEYLKLWKYDEAKDQLKKFFSLVDDEIIAHRKTLVKGQHRDYIDGYVQEMDKREDPERDGFSVRNLKGNVRSMFTAGSEATRTSIEWTLVMMAAFQDYQEKIHQEISLTIGRERMPTMEDMPKTPLTHAAVLEVLRWTGTAPLGIVRKVTEDEKLLGYDIPKGTLAVPHIWGVLHDPNLWDDPMTFKPERFISKEGKVIKPEYFIPFSYGRRACPGQSLANIELYIYFAAILQNFRVFPPEDNTGFFDEELGITLMLKNTRLRLVERLKE